VWTMLKNLMDIDRFTEYQLEYMEYMEYLQLEYSSVVPGILLVVTVVHCWCTTNNTQPSVCLLYTWYTVVIIRAVFCHRKIMVYTIIRIVTRWFICSYLPLDYRE
jgi:hypothetical protein